MLKHYYPAETHSLDRGEQTILLNVERSTFFCLTPAEEAVVKAAQNKDWVARSELEETYGVQEIQRAFDHLQNRGILVSTGPLSHDLPAWVGPGPITGLRLNVTQGCNMKCKYCFADHGTYGEAQGTFSAEMARSAVDLLLDASRQASQCSILFFGGEPMLNFETITATVEYAEQKAMERDKHIDFWINTNGTLFDDENVAFIKKHKIHLEISLDGPPTTHNRMRTFPDGRGSYQAILDHLPHLLTQRTSKLRARATITRNNVDCQAILDHLLELGFEHVILEPVFGEGQSYVLDHYALTVLKQELNQLARRFLLQVPQGELSAGMLFLPYLIDFCSGVRRRTYCRAGTNVLGISVSGKLYPCHLFVGLPDYCLGDLEHGIDEVKRQEWCEENDLLAKPACESCWARFLCGGGCPGISARLSGDIHHPYLPSCDLTRHLIELAILIHTELLTSHPACFLSLPGLASFTMDWGDKNG